jgi:hypothetical protein
MRKAAPSPKFTPPPERPARGHDLGKGLPQRGIVLGPFDALRMPHPSGINGAEHVDGTPNHERDALVSRNGVNVLGTQRVNRGVLPHMRRQKQGLLIWISSSSSAGGTPPYLAPYFAAKAGMDALAVQYARELSRWGIETTIVVPGAFTKGTNHFAHSGRPADAARLAEYDAGPYKGFGEEVQKAFAAIVPEDADANGVAEAIVDIVDTPFGKRPFRAHYDPTEDGANVGFAVLDRLRSEMLHRVGLSDLLKPKPLV